MSLPAPLEALDQAARRIGLNLDEATLRAYARILESTFAEYDQVDALIDPRPRCAIRARPACSRKTTRWAPGTCAPTSRAAPASADRQARGAEGQYLPGRRADDEWRVHAAGYVPDLDATVATRVLDAGGRIVGKAHCEYFCFSGSSHTNAAGPVRNPRNPAHSSGGSSSGAAALVGAGEADMAIGTDQGGSVRIPAAYSGIYGMKPTHGLIPYTGIMPIEMTLDHAGIMTANVADNALLLDAIAGSDGLDPRQQGLPAARSAYCDALGRQLAGLRIGIVPESFGWHNSEPEVDDAVRQAAARLAALGAEVIELSIPLHRQGHAIWTPIAVEGSTQQMKGYNYGSNWKGLYVTSLMQAQRHWRDHADEFPHDVKTCLLAGEYFHARYGGQYYAKAQNLARRLGHAYDTALTRVDALLMPTVPMRAPRLIDAGAAPDLHVTRALEMNANTAPSTSPATPPCPCPAHYATACRWA